MASSYHIKGLCGFDMFQVFTQKHVSILYQLTKQNFSYTYFDCSYTQPSPHDGSLRVVCSLFCPFRESWFTYLVDSTQ